MPFWFWLAVGLVAGAAPSLFARSAIRPWVARQCWWLAFGLVAACILLPCGLVLIMFLSDSAFDAIREMGWFFVSEEFGWATALISGGLVGSGATAWLHRRAPRLQGPPLSEEVAALARDPDKLLEAIQLYRQQTGVGLAVATDVVEGFRARQRRLRRTMGTQGQLGAIEWMYVGFGTAWYAALAGGYALSLRSQTNHFITALAFFVFIPGLFGGFCGLAARSVSPQVKAALLAAFRSERLTRRYALTAGLLAGLLSLAAVTAVAFTVYSISHGETSVWCGLGAIAVVLTAAPFVGLWLLKKRIA